MSDNGITTGSTPTEPELPRFGRYYFRPDQKIGAFGLPDSTRDLFDEILRFLPDETVDSALSISLTVHRILTRMADASLRPQSEKRAATKNGYSSQ